MESFWTQWTDSVAMLHQWIICCGVTSQWHKGAPLSVSKLGIEGKLLQLLFLDPWEGFSPPGTLSELTQQGEKMAPDSHLWIYHLWTRVWVRTGKKQIDSAPSGQMQFCVPSSEVAASRTDVTHREVSQSMTTSSIHLQEFECISKFYYICVHSIAVKISILSWWFIFTHVWVRWAKKLMGWKGWTGGRFQRWK